MEKALWVREENIRKAKSEDFKKEATGNGVKATESCREVKINVLISLPIETSVTLMRTHSG